jgi:hypothetical protein
VQTLIFHTRNTQFHCPFITAGQHTARYSAFSASQPRICMPKRRQSETLDVDDIIDSVDQRNGLRDGLVGLPPDELMALLADLANSANIPTSALQKARVNLPSFSPAK